MDNNDRKETVIVDRGEKRSSASWIVGLVLVVLLVLVFFATNGFGLFNMAGTDTNSINVDTPDTVNVQPTQ